MAQPSPAAALQSCGAKPGTEIPTEVTITLTGMGGGEGAAGQGSGGPRATQAGRAPSRRC